ncbi:nickel pincer cofactor biosynthesis protein LarB [Roseomonas marmotae]|uniref:Nickel pincer cofactor biosynthesis protein LarB n=1 Tax=Roseomonas marmotae TaxID=2768161 RepID=A0ABS3KFM8_9PROT|nr:nickel pincer cofactor biosynthesis protein LarB [Roseomonas marmotae]MBO1076273.1 nickel pincer cofactor biosynthesis protein LarB [Roseomonas marmotae]QTI77846.1 nickel pincer cofactor biosynthesis protein LarB [Roseomonas marmotae]
MPDFVLDFGRRARTGTAEAILCGHKTPAQIDAILAAAAQAGQSVLLTRLDPACFSALDPAHHARLSYDPLSRTAVLDEPAAPAVPQPGIGIVTAGTSDLAVAGEAARTLRFHGFDAPVIADIGVAGLWRLMERIEEIRRFRVVIAIAGMEGALFSVLGGLLAAPVIAVPSSVGYGVSAGGRAALDSALSTCAPGVVAVNIDNGFGAACAAILVLRAGGPAPQPQAP